MKTIFTIFRQDLKSVTKNLIIFVVIIGICILPALYAWFNIASNWDPYSSTGEMPFAVCSLDKGFRFKGIDLNAGDTIISNLKQNNRMGWRFVDTADEAIEGAENGEYYAAIVIPADFSENLLSISTGAFKQAKFEYYVNEKKNAVAPKITDAGSETLRESVDAAYVSTLAKTIATTLNVTGEELEESKDTLAKKVTDALNDTKAELKNFIASVDLLTATLDSIDNLIKANKELEPTIQKALADAGVVTSDVKSALQSTQTTAAQLSGTLESVISSADSYMESISSQLYEAFGTLSADASAVSAKLNNIITVNQKVIAVNNRLISILENIQSSLGVDCSRTIALLNDANSKQNAIIDKINSICDAIKSTGAIPENAKSELDELIAQANASLSSVKTSYASVKGNIDDAMTKSFSSLDGVTDFLQTVSGGTTQFDTALSNASSTTQSLKKVMLNLKDYLNDTVTRIDNAVKRVEELKSDDTLEKMLMPVIENPKALGEFLSAPVSSETHRLHSIENYGSAMTPFYSSLALWVGGVVLVAVLNVDVSPKNRKGLKKVNDIQLFFGRYLTFFFIGQIQAWIIALGDLFFLKIQCTNHWLFIAACLFSSFVYTLFIYSLTITFSVIGKALAVIILVIQIAGSGGTFPIEVLPAPFKAVSPYLPFKYGINALRETVAGADLGAYFRFIGTLALFIIPALLLGLLLRKPCIKIISFFNHKIDESELVI